MAWCQNRIFGAEFSREEIEEAVRDNRLLSMEIEFNSNCNFHCVYCYSPNISNGKKDMSRDEFRDIICQAKALGAKKIIILGGEPMLYPHIVEMIHFINELGLRIELFTNGTNMTLPMAGELLDKGVTVVLKMNTMDEKLQDMLSGQKGSFAQIQAAFKNLKEAGYPARHPMGVSTVICKQNIDEIVGMWDWLREQDIEPYFEMTSPHGNAKVNSYLQVETDRVREIFHEISDLDRKKYGHCWEPQPPLIGGNCIRHQYSCYVTSGGDVQPCVGVSIPVGNLKKARLGDIIRESEVMRDLRNYRRNIKGPCGECPSNSECYGCRGTSYQVTGDYLASDPTCWKNSGRKQEIVCLPADARGLVPHEPPMLMISDLVEIREKSAVIEAKIGDDNIFIGENGRLEDAAFVEIIAQAIAVKDGFANLGKIRAKVNGFLVGIRNMEITGSARGGDRLKVRVQKTARYGEVTIVKGEVYKGEDMIARGEIKVWLHESGA